MTFKADMNAINLNECSCSNKPSVAQENIYMDTCIEPNTDIDQDVTMNELTADTALKNCTTKYKKHSD